MSWDNNSVNNQTVDLFPSGEDDFFTVAPAGSGEKNTGTWSVYGATVDDTPDSVTNSKLYLDYSDVSWWADDNVRAAASFFNSSSTNEWANMVSVDTTNKYFEFQIPNGNWTNVIFTRMNPAHQENDRTLRLYMTQEIPKAGNNISLGRALIFPKRATRLPLP